MTLELDAYQPARNRDGASHDGRLASSAAFVIALVAFSFSALGAIWLGSGQLAGLGFSGFAVPDAISLEKSVHLAWSVNWEQIPNIRTFLGTVLVYYPVIIFGDLYALFANVLLLSVSAVLFKSVICRLDTLNNPNRTWIVALILVASNVYIIGCLLYPNKEIPLIFLTTVVLIGLMSRRWYLAALAIFLTYWFRDGYALILSIVAIVVFFRRFTFVSGGIISALFLVLLFVAFPIQDFSGIDRSLQRNVAIGAVIAGDKFSALGDVAAYSVRLIGNALNLGLRPQMIDVRGGIYLLGVGYWQFGIILLAGLIWSAQNLLSSGIARGSLALVILTTLLGISYGTFVQPRYMMPLILPLSLGLSESRLGRYMAIPAAVTFPIIFLIIGGLPPLAGG